MNPLFAALIVFSSLTSLAQAYPDYPGSPGGNYPPPYQGASCKLEFTGNYYYVSKDGSRFTELTASLPQAIQQKQQLENSGMCNAYAQDPGTCQLEYTGNYYYVSRNGNRFSELVSGYQAALQTRDQLYQSRNCNENTYRPTASCKIEYTGNYYYVSRNGNRFSDLVSDLNQVTRTRDDLTRNYVCQAQYQSAPCRLEFTGNYYYLSINGARSSDLNASLPAVLNQQSDFARRGLCSAPSQGERCTLEYTGNYYYVARSGARLSELVSNLQQADGLLRQLQYSRNCY